MQSLRTFIQIKALLNMMKTENLRQRVYIHDVYSTIVLQSQLDYKHSNNNRFSDARLFI